MQVLGCNYRYAPLALRERFAFSPEQSRSALERWRGKFPGAEAVLLSTCNRVELYTASENGGAPTSRQVIDFLARCHRLDVEEFVGAVYDFDGRESVRHLFLVASSLDSMVVGEPQISSQVKRAYQLATEQEATGPLMHAVFQAAAKVGRRVARETAIHTHRVSIPSVAIGEFAARIFERFDKKKTLVIGAGKMAEETLQYLRNQGASDLTIINRNPRRAIDLARRCQGQACPWDQLFPKLTQADLIVSTTGSVEPIVSEEMFATVQRARNGRPLFILDLAVPRDFAPAIGDQAGVYLYSVDDLRAVCEQNRRLRDRELPAAVGIVEKETDRFMAKLHHRATGPVVRRLKQVCDEPKEVELDRLFQKIPELDEHARHEIRYAFDRLTNKLLHRPLEALRSESRDGVPTGLLDAVSRLFQFKD
ncbi:MAG: glutamyl-tRNA reductase [Pirellulaceae bacterium]